MKSSTLRLTSLFAAATTAAISTLPIAPAQAVTFSETAVDQSKFIAVASPYGQGLHQLLVLEQKSSQRQCWSETGSNPVIVDPLLLKFDFSGICGRSTDANGYSIRLDGEDLGVKYSLRVRRRNNDLVLVGIPEKSGDPEIEIGRAGGVTEGFAKLTLDPQWRFSKRTYNKKVLGHIYLSKGISSVPFPDVANDLYLKEIREAVALGFISGFTDNTFRPTASLTREQLVSMVLESLKNLPNTSFSLPTSVSSSPFPDVASSRWSAAKIAFARQNDIVSGYEDGQFRPERTVTRAEMMAVLKKAALYAKKLRNLSPSLDATQSAFTFSDTTSHWADAVIGEMSSYCGVASPVNERGTAFSPDQAAQRNYAAAATLRMLNCAKQ